MVVASAEGATVGKVSEAMAEAAMAVTVKAVEMVVVTAGDPAGTVSEVKAEAAMAEAVKVKVTTEEAAERAA